MLVFSWSNTLTIAATFSQPVANYMIIQAGFNDDVLLGDFINQPGQSTTQKLTLASLRKEITKQTHL